MYSIQECLQCYPVQQLPSPAPYVFCQGAKKRYAIKWNDFSSLQTHQIRKQIQDHKAVTFNEAWVYP